MNKEAEKVALSEEQKKLLAREYRDITQRIVASGTWVWQTMAVLAGGFILAAALVSRSGGAQSFRIYRGVHPGHRHNDHSLAVLEQIREA